LRVASSSARCEASIRGYFKKWTGSGVAREWRAWRAWRGRPARGFAWHGHPWPCAPEHGQDARATSERRCNAHGLEARATFPSIRRLRRRRAVARGRGGPLSG
jgi:hypothetical protein